MRGLGAERPIAVLHRPIVVTADGRGVVVALTGPWRRQLGRQIIHYRSTQSNRVLAERPLVGLVDRIERTALEIVPQAERVAHFVHGYFLDSLDRELFDLILRARGAGQHDGAERQLVRHAVHNLTGTVPSVRMGLLPAIAGQIERPASKHRYACGRKEFVFAFPGLQIVGVEHDVGVENLSRRRIDARRPHRHGSAGRDPTKRVVAHVARLPTGIVRLLPYLNGVLEANLFEGLVPLQNSSTNRLAIFVGDGLFDPEDNRLLGGRERFGRVLLFQVPTVDVPHEPVLVHLTGVVFHDRKEIADAVVGQTGLVIGLRQAADRVMDVNRHGPRIGYRLDLDRTVRRVGGGHLQFYVVRKPTDLRPRGPLG